MYIAELINDNRTTEIHGVKSKLKNGNVVQGINTIDSFSFSILPSNNGFNKIDDFKTLVSVFNERKNKYEFQGRVLYSSPVMEETGLLYKEVVCESFFGFLCDSVQLYVEERNWAVRELLEHVVGCHNSQTEDYKHFVVGEVDETLDPNNNLYVGIQRQNTWETIQEKLIQKLGGEIRFRVVDGLIYIDYLKEFGHTSTTEIALSKNMKSIRKENDPTNCITRLIPLGNKLTVEEITTDDEGNETVTTRETEQRLDISSVNDGKMYIDDEDAVKAFGIRVGVVEFDDVSDAANLLHKGQEWLAETNKIQIKYSVTALDLSLIGLEIDDFEICNKYPIKNALLGIDDTARIIKKNLDICEETASSFEIGDNFKTLSDIQLEQSGKLDSVVDSIGKIESDYITNEALKNETLTMSSLIEQTVSSILLSIEEVYAKETTLEEFKETITTDLEVLSGEIVASFTTATEEISRVDGDLQTRFEEIRKEIVASDEGLVIRTSDSVISLQMDNEEGIVFRRNGIPFGRWDGENFYTGNIVVQVNERAQFGNFAFIPRSDGSLMFLKVGD